MSADDFRVDGVAPLDAKINARAQGDTAKGEAVYLQVSQMDTDARPEVQLTGEIKDKAGNIRSDGRLAAIADGLKPILTVTPSADLAQNEITVTISSQRDPAEKPHGRDDDNQAGQGRSFGESEDRERVPGDGQPDQVGRPPSRTPRARPPGST